MTFRSLVPLLLAFTASISFGADILHMKDGTKREGTIKEEKADVLVFEYRHGSLKATVEIDRKDVAKVETRNAPDSPAERKYKLLLQEVDYLAGNPADLLNAWKRIAEFCEKTPGYESAAREAQSRIAALDPAQRANSPQTTVISSPIYDESLPPEHRYSIVRLSKTPYVAEKFTPQTCFPSTDASYAEFEARSAAYRAGTAYNPNATTSQTNNSTDAYNGTSNNRAYAYTTGSQYSSVLVYNIPNSYSNGYSTGRDYWSSRASIVSPFPRTTTPNSYIPASPTSGTIGSFQDARNSHYQVPNSYFGVSTGNYDTRTQRWIGQRQ